MINWASNQLEYSTFYHIFRSVPTSSDGDARYREQYSNNIRVAIPKTHRFDSKFGGPEAFQIRYLVAQSPSESNYSFSQRRAYIIICLYRLRSAQNKEWLRSTGGQPPIWTNVPPFETSIFPLSNGVGFMAAYKAVQK